jgi:hypothetical protein
MAVGNCPPRRYAIVFAAPPCTNLAVSGARWFKEKGVGGLTEAIEIVEACRRICEWSRFSGTICARVLD